MKRLIEMLERIERALKQESLNSKEYLNMEESSLYLDVSLSYLYKLTSTGQLPMYKPTGKLIFLKREDLLRWLEDSKCSSSEEIHQKASQIRIGKQ